MITINFYQFPDANYVEIYSCILGLVLPLAIMLIEKISKNPDYIIVETYLKNAMMFPFIVYFCINLIVFTVLNEKYYFIFTIFISIILMLYMYCQSFKLLSDLRFEKERVNEVRYKLVDNDLKDQIKHFDSVNRIGKYLKYGIKIANLDYINTYNYKRKIIYPSRELIKIDQYNYHLVEKIVNILNIINKDYIKNNELIEKESNKNEVRPKVVIELLELGATTKKDCHRKFDKPLYLC